MWLSMSSVAGVVAPAEDLLKPRSIFDRGVPDFSAGAVGVLTHQLGDLLLS
jgi:hypothetical protein